MNNNDIEQQQNMMIMNSSSSFDARDRIAAMNICQAFDCMFLLMRTWHK